jgi:hypothetical protein
MATKPLTPKDRAIIRNTQKKKRREFAQNKRNRAAAGICPGCGSNVGRGNISNDQYGNYWCINCR